MKEKLKSELMSMAENLYLWRNVLAIIGITSLMLPWAKLDGASGSVSGSDLIAYLLTGSERLDMIRNSFLGTASLFLVPVCVLATTIMVWTKAFTEKTAIKLNIIAIILPVPMLIFAGGITSSDNISKGIMTPQTGVIIMVLTQAAMIALEAFMISGKPLPWRRGEGVQDDTERVSQKPRQSQKKAAKEQPRTEDQPRDREQPRPAPAHRIKEQAIGELYSSEPDESETRENRNAQSQPQGESNENEGSQQSRHPASERETRRRGNRPSRLVQIRGPRTERESQR